MILHTVTNGTGELIVFLHQGLQTSETDFREQREFFKENYQVIQVDLRGHGKSVTTDYEDYAEKSAIDLKETLESLQVENAHFVGSSLGALAGLIFAKRFPEMVKSLVISGIIPHKPDNWDELMQEQTELQNEVMEKQEAVEYFNRIHDGDWVGLLKFSQAVEWYPFEESGDLSMLQMPTLFLVGEANPWEVVGAIEYPKQNKGIRVAVIPFAGHLPLLDQPEIYNRIVQQFLMKTGE